MTDFTNLRNACRAASEALTAAQAAERDARRELQRAAYAKMLQEAGVKA